MPTPTPEAILSLKKIDKVWLSKRIAKCVREIEYQSDHNRNEARADEERADFEAFKVLQLLMEQ